MIRDKIMKKIFGKTILGNTINLEDMTCMLSRPMVLPVIVLP